MMRPQLMLLSFVTFYSIIQVFFYGSKASQNSGNDCILTSDDVLEINTTAPSINCSSCNYTSSLQNRSSPHGSHLVAHIEFSGNIEFKSGSTVKVFGKYALSITSQNGNISVHTDVNMTCGEEVFDTTCLGGFTQNSTGQTVGKGGNTNVELYKGLGPGGLIIINDDVIPKSQCTPGASHGGRGGKSTNSIDFKSPEPYDKDNITTLLGGSGGSCLDSSGDVAGGGAIELVAEKGEIIIGAPIRAHAQTDSTKRCSGGSGGLIRLKSRRVVVQEEGRLIVDGGNGHSPGVFYRVGGGAGGIIQIIAPEGELATGTLSLKYGDANDKIDCEVEAESGYFLLKANETTSPKHNFTKPYLWPPRPNNTEATASTYLLSPTASIVATKTSPTVIQSSSSAAPTTGYTVKQQLSQLMEDVRTIIESDNVNKSAIHKVITTHQALASSANLTEEIMDLCVRMFEEYQAIMVKIANEDLKFVEKTSRKILEAASSCLDEKNHAVWKKNGRMPGLMENLQDIFVDMVRINILPELNYTLSTKKVVAVVERKLIMPKMENIRIPDYSVIKDNLWNDVSDYVWIPKETVQNAKANYTYIVLLYKDVENGLPNNATSSTEEDWEVSSFVMSCYLKLDNNPVYDLSPPAVLSFKTLLAEDRRRHVQCSFWNANRSVWSTDGVQELKSNSSSTNTVCQTEHFTSFAILMQHTKISLSEEDSFALSIITYIGCGVSTGALIITLIVFLSIESLSSERHKIHTNLVVSLLLANVLFLAGIRETASQFLCKVIAVLMHYFFLTAFTWMLVEGLHLYLKVVQVFRTENIKMIYYYVFGWGFSVLPVVITLAMRPNSYGNREVCWLSSEDGTIWAFIGPVVAIIVINSFVLIMVVKTVVTSASAVKSSDHAHIKAGIKGLFVLMPILGVGWILGLFALNEGTKVFVYAFAIVNGFQGVLIFLLHCVFNSEVRQAFRRQKEKHALSKENESQYNASFSLSQSDYGTKKMSHSGSFDRLKATLSFKRKSTAKMVQVQPVGDSHDVTESSLQVKRAFQEKSSLRGTDVGNQDSSLNCPMETERRITPKMTHIMNEQATTAKRKRSRP